MNESEHNPLMEKSWRRKLTPAEAAELQAWLADHPEARADCEAELRLTEAMNRLPDAPVPSNFTACVLQAVERESGAESRSRTPHWKWSLRLLLPRAAMAAVVLGAGFLSYRQHSIVEHRTELAQRVKVVAALPNPEILQPEILQNFDTIQKMGPAAAGPDRVLIALMQ
jgi:anti-sigma factor RsiW